MNQKLLIIFSLMAFSSFCSIVTLLYDRETNKKIKKVSLVHHILNIWAYLSAYLYLLPVRLCLCVAYNILRQYNRPTIDQKGCWQESKSTQIPVVYSSYLTSRGLATIPLAQHGLHSAKHGTIGPAMEALCTLTPEEIGSLVMEELSGGTAVRLLTVG